jgi:amidase
MLDRLDGTAQAELVRRGDVSPLELAEAAMCRIERLDPIVNAVPIRLFEEARLAAGAADLPQGPFRGVPFLLKDIGTAFAGQPYYMGNRALRATDHRSPRDHTLALRFRSAGLVVVGKSAVPEFGVVPYTQSSAFGVTRNPFDRTLSVGGSSGGSCAAVAAGMVPVAHASDGGGSIRIPAAWCGVVGLKPSRGRVPSSAINITRSDVEFVVARSVRDVAGVLDAVHGNEPGDLYLAPPPARSFTVEPGVMPARLRIGMLPAIEGMRIHRESVAATESTAHLLETLGHDVEIAWPSALFERPAAAHPGLPLVGFRYLFRDLARMLGRPVQQDDVEAGLWSVANLPVPPVAAEEYIEHGERVQEWVARVAAWWAGGFDLLLTPTVCEPAVPIERIAALAADPAALGALTMEHCALTLPFNLTGQPAVSLPLHWTPEGHPVGVQLVAAMGREDVLLQVSSQLESARPWHDRYQRLDPMLGTAQEAP